MREGEESLPLTVRCHLGVDAGFDGSALEGL